jgi:hypothetical protein
MSILDDLSRLSQLSELIPEKLTQARYTLSNLRAELESMGNLVKDREADTLSLVSAELSPPIVGKPTFSNKEAREAEVRHRLTTDQAYKKLVVDTAEVQRRKSDAEIQLSRLQDEDKALDRQFEAVGLALRAAIGQGLEQAIRLFVTSEAQRFTREDAQQ